MQVRKLLFAAVGASCLVACGDDESTNPDGRPPGDPDARQADASVDAAPYVAPTPIPLVLSATGPDQMMSVAAAPGGGFYAAGYVATAVDAPRFVTVIKLTADGALDTAFAGGDGIATTSVEFRGGTDEIDVALQTDGKLIVSATIADATDPDDRDVAVLRLDGTTGDLDDTFGVDGIRRLDLNTAHDNGTALVGLDAARAVGVDGTNRIYVHALQRGEGLAPGGGPRTDTDFTLVRLSADGALDTDYAEGGKHLLDIQGGTPAAPLNATARGIHVFADGSVLASGYTTNPSLSPGPQPVLYRLDAAGDPVAGFATAGVFHDLVLSTQTEIYGIAVHATNVVTAGYGRESGDQNDWVSLRFDTDTGARDMTWGGATAGAVVFDPSGAMIGDNCRNAVGLGDRTLLIGSTGPSNMPEQDAVFAVLDATGRLDAAFGDGIHTYAFGGGAGGNDQLWGGAAAGDRALLVGWKGGGMTQTETMNDDTYALVVTAP